MPVGSRDECKIGLRYRKRNTFKQYQYGDDVQVCSSSLYHPPFVKDSFAKSSRSPGSVLNGGTSPVLSFQNMSR